MLSGSLFCAEHFSDLPLYLGYSAGNNSFTHKEFIQHKYLPQETNQQITFCFSFLRNAAPTQESEQVYLWLQILNYNPPAGRKSKGTVSIVICPESIYILIQDKHCRLTFGVTTKLKKVTLCPNASILRLTYSGEETDKNTKLKIDLHFSFT